MDVVIDTDILSTFAKIGKLNLLRMLFPKSKILLVPSVFKEIKKGVRLRIVTFVQPPSFSKIKLDLAERRLIEEIRKRKNLGLGDAECIAVAKHRNCLFLTNDHEAQTEANSLSVDHLSLTLLLRALWKNRVMSKDRVGKLIDEIEKKDRVVIKNKHLIFV